MKVLFCGRATVTPKYVRYVNKVYPKTRSDGISKYNMPKLTYYAVTNPNKLPKICKQLVGRLDNSLQRNRKHEAITTMHILDELIQSCHTDLSLFAVYIIRMVRMLLDVDSVEYKLVAMNTFVIFISFEDETILLRQMTDLISGTVDMCTNEDMRLRLKGHEGLRSILRMKGPFENQVLEHVQKIVYSILENHHKLTPEVDTDEEVQIDRSVDHLPAEEMIPVLAHECLRELVSRFSLHVRAILNHILDYCDEFNVWTDEEDSIPLDAILKLFVQQSSQCAYLSIVQMTLHIEKRDNIQIKIRIIRYLEMMVLSVKGSIAGLVLKVVGSMEDHLVQPLSGEAVVKEGKGQDMKKKVKGGDDADSLANLDEYRKCLISAIGACSRKLVDAEQHASLMNFIAQRIPSSVSSVSDKDEARKGNEEQRRLVLLSLRAVSLNFALKKNALELAFPSLLQTLMGLARDCHDGENRLIALTVLTHILTTPSADYRYEDDDLAKNYKDDIFSVAVEAALVLDNEWRHYAAIDQLLGRALYRFQAWGLESGLQRVLALQDKALSTSNPKTDTNTTSTTRMSATSGSIPSEGLSDLQRHAIQAMISSFLSKVAASYNCAELTTLVGNWAKMVSDIIERHPGEGDGVFYLEESLGVSGPMQTALRVNIIDDRSGSQPKCAGMDILGEVTETECQPLKKTGESETVKEPKSVSKTLKVEKRKKGESGALLSSLCEIPHYVSVEVAELVGNSTELSEELGRKATFALPTVGRAYKAKAVRETSSFGILTQMQEMKESAKSSMKGEDGETRYESNKSTNRFLDVVDKDAVVGGVGTATAHNPSVGKPTSADSEVVTSVDDLRSSLHASTNGADLRFEGSHEKSSRLLKRGISSALSANLRGILQMDEEEDEKEENEGSFSSSIDSTDGDSENRSEKEGKSELLLESSVKLLRQYPLLL